MRGIFVFIRTIFRALFLLLASASITVLALTRAAEVNQRPINPFAAYTDMMPGQPRGNIQAHRIKCLVQHITSASSMLQCSMPPEEAIFEIKVHFSSFTDKVTDTAFTLREKMTFGQAILLWGKPQIDMVGEVAFFNWPHSHVTATAQTDNRPISYWLPIMEVAFYSVD